MASFFKHHWFVCFLIGLFAMGYHQSQVFRPILEWQIARDAIVFFVMWAMGFTLPAAQFRDSLRDPKPALLAISINTVIVPLLVLPCYYWLPTDFFGGLFVSAIVPSTLASASVWTRRAGGNDSVSMMTTVVTNLGCVVVVPLGIWLVLEQQAQLDPWLQVTKLTILVVIPLVLSQIMRHLGAGAWADRHKSGFGLATQFGILAMVFWGSISSSVVPSDGTASPTGELGPVSLLVICVSFIHSVALWLGIILARRAKLLPRNQIAVGFAGSQKTLMIGLQIAIECGVSVLPMIVYHVGQLLIDTVVADRWKQKYSDP